MRSLVGYYCDDNKWYSVTKIFGKVGRNFFLTFSFSRCRTLTFRILSSSKCGKDSFILNLVTLKAGAKLKLLFNELACLLLLVCTEIKH